MFWRAKKKEKSYAGRLTPETKGYAAYGFVVYCDKKGRFPDFDKVVGASGLPCFVVCHYRDSDGGCHRKPLHFHVMVLYDKGKEAAPVFRLCKALGGSGLCPAYSPYAYARYLCHLDSPDSYYYSPDDVMCINGCVYKEFIKKED